MEDSAFSNMAQMGCIVSRSASQGQFVNTSIICVPKYLLPYWAGELNQLLTPFISLTMPPNQQLCDQIREGAFKVILCDPRGYKLLGGYLHGCRF